MFPFLKFNVDSAFSAVSQQFFKLLLLERMNKLSVLFIA